MSFSQMELKENKKRMESKRKLNPTSEPRKGSKLDPEKVQIVKNFRSFLNFWLGFLYNMDLFSLFIVFEPW